MNRFLVQEVGKQLAVSMAGFRKTDTAATVSEWGLTYIPRPHGLDCFLTADVLTNRRRSQWFIVPYRHRNVGFLLGQDEYFAELSG